MLPLITGVIASVLLLINTLLWASLLIVLAFIKVAVANKRVRATVTLMLNHIAQNWVSGNKAWMHLTQAIDWHVDIPDNLNPKGWYFVTSNHQSWVDILVLQYVFNRRIPVLKFFLKQELIKVPIMGIAWWALDFPFMKRYSKAYLEKHPEKKGQDIETTRQACEKFKQLPTSVVNFLEGTRFTDGKRAEQQSPFEHLLKPKSGGMAFAMNAMGDQFKSILNVTLYYPQGIPTFWDFLQGKMQRCHIEVTEIDIPDNLANGSYDSDPEYRQQFQDWTQAMWQEKDARLRALNRPD